MAKKTKASSAAVAPAGTPRMLEHYLGTVRPQLAAKLGRTNPHAIPRLQKIVVNMGVGVAVSEKKYLEEAIGAMAQITGQKPIATLSKQAVAGFKLRENLPIGCKSPRSPGRESGTSAACPARPSTATATTASGSPSKWCFRKSIPTATRGRRA